MRSPATDSLLGVFQQLTDPRDRRGVRHPFAGLLAITFLGLLGRQPDSASIARWAEHHWPTLKDAFGLTRAYAPRETTYSRAAARFSVDEFRSALTRWLARVMVTAPVTAAVDGKTSKPAHAADGDPIRVLNVFAHGVRACPADRPVGDGKGTEPDVLKARLDDLFTLRPSLRVLTGDALFRQRPLARAIIDAGRDYVLAVELNRPDLHETIRTAFADATPASADATTCEKNAGRSRPDTSGATRRPPSTRARRSSSPARGWWCVWIGTPTRRTARGPARRVTSPSARTRRRCRRRSCWG